MPAELVDAPPARWFDRYNGTRLAPLTRAKIVQMLAQPREQVPYAKILQDCDISVGVLYAIKDQEQETIAQRKQVLMAQAFRIAERAAMRVEETIDSAGCSQAAVVGGIYSEKALLFAGEPTQNIQVTISAQDIYSELRTIQAEIVSSLATDVPFLKIQDAK